jgi:hypothetical protein
MTGTWIDQRNPRGERGTQASTGDTRSSEEARRRDLASLSDLGRVRPFNHCGDGERRQHPQVCNGARLSGKFAHPYGARLARGRNDQVYLRASLELGALCLIPCEREHRRALSLAPEDAPASRRNTALVEGLSAAVGECPYTA